MSDLCRCADEVRCDMKAEIERLTAENKRLRESFSEYWRAMDFYSEDSDAWIEAHQTAKVAIWTPASDKQEPTRD